MSSTERVRPFAAVLADLVLPRRCAGCGRPGVALCAWCRPGARPMTVRAGSVEVAAAGRYESGLRAALIAYKERGRTELAGPLGALLADAIASLGGADTGDPGTEGVGTEGVGTEGVGPNGLDPVGGAGVGARAAGVGAAAMDAGAVPICLVPVPSSRRAVRTRGGDHLVRLARRAGRREGFPVVRALRLARPVRDSAGLTRQQRAANLAGALAADPSRGRVAVVVDDIVTTGATLHEAIRALTAAGWPVAGAAVLAATPRRV